MGLDLDLWARRADGSEFPVEVSLSPVTFGHGPRTVAMVRDVSAHWVKERLTRDRLVLADQERIGAELRSHVINRLFATGMGIQVLVNGVEPKVARSLLDLADELDQVIREIRYAVFLPPPEPDDPAV